MCVRYDKIDGFIKVHDKIRYLVLFDEWCDKIYDRINYLISKKSGITDSINYNYKQNWFTWFFAYWKNLTFHVIILIKLVINKYKNDYY